MAESNDTHHHVVEIPVSGDHQKQMISTIEAIQDHPLMEISESPGHLLLLKLWQREEDLFGQKIAKKELQIDALRSEIFHLYWKLNGQMQRERNDSRALTRCVQELRMKGVSFDLSKEPGNGKRMKSSSVEIKWKPISWCSQYLVTVCLVGVMGLAVPVCRFMLC